MPVDPFTHNPEAHEDGDPMPDNDHSDPVTVTDVFESHLHDVDPPVTVADLLDAYDDIGRWRFLAQRADQDVITSADRINDVLLDYHGFSPSERAEFDRRTAG